MWLLGAVPCENDEQCPQVLGKTVCIKFQGSMVCASKELADILGQDDPHDDTQVLFEFIRLLYLGEQRKSGDTFRLGPNHLSFRYLLD